MFSLSILRFFSYMLKDARRGTLQEHWCRTVSKGSTRNENRQKVTWKMQRYQRKPACCTHLQLNQTFLIQTCHKQPGNQAKSWQIDYSGMQQAGSIFLTTSLAKWTKLHLYFECLYLNCTVVITCPRIPNCVETWSALASHTPFHQHALLSAIPPRSHWKCWKRYRQEADMPELERVGHVGQLGREPFHQLMRSGKKIWQTGLYQ